MNPKLWTLAALAAALAALPGAQADSGMPAQSCNNYGIAVNTYVNSSPDCSSHDYTMYCDQGTGAGAGAGAGGVGGSQAEAEATAGSRCTQNNGSNGNETGIGGPTLGTLPVVQVINEVIQDGIHVSPGGFVDGLEGGPGEDELPLPEAGEDLPEVPEQPVDDGSGDGDAA